ncbi:MAG: hypothetical protein CM1200mP14_17900 [Gammaproteobacteria bacterium]|nr:MAG: hypothetical protein CM1200mP14_17900 [Gammaproteobacteria bacterium]
MTEGSTFGFDRALELGIVNEIYDHEEDDAFLAAVLDYAANFTTPGKANKGPSV